MKNTWFRMETKSESSQQDAAPTIVDIHIIDFIGDWIDDWIARNWGYDMGVTARGFIEQLAALPASVKTVNVHLNTPGGDCFAALTIANALRDQQKTKGRTVETFVDGLAASAGSIIMMAGSKVHVADNALVMVHNPWTVAMGNAADLTKAISTLNQVRDTIVATYKWHSTLEADALIALLDAETWMNADEAIANGLATDKIEGLAVAASIDPRAAAKLKVPDQYRARVEALLKKPAEEPKAAAAADVLRLCKAANVLDIADALLAENATTEIVNARIADEQRKRTDASTRATQIRTLCTNAKVGELADGFVTSNMTVDAVKAQLTVITAKLDKVEIDNHLPSDLGGAPKAKLVAADIYAARKKATITN